MRLLVPRTNPVPDSPVSPYWLPVHRSIVAVTDQHANIEGVLVVDAANVIGSKPNGWWRDRPGAARQFVEQLRDAGRHGRIPLPAVVVLEGAARAGVTEADVDGVRVVHAAHHGDDTLVAETAAASDGVVFVSADRRLWSVSATSVPRP